MPRITTKGQVTVPKGIRDLLGVEPGDDLEFRVTENKQVVLARSRTGSSFARYEGFLTDLAGQDPDALVDDLRGDAE